MFCVWISAVSDLLCLVWCSDLLDVGRRRGGLALAGALVVTALGVDELREPADLPLDGLHAVTLELHRVAVHLLLGLLQLVLDPVEPLLETAAPALQDPQPGADVGAAEEREPYVEVVVLPRGRPDVGHQPLELLVAGRGELVDDPLAAARRARLGRRDVLGDPAGLEHLLQRRVERAVGQQPAPAEHAVDLLAQLVAVHGRLVQQPEDGELEGLPTTGHGAAPSPDRCSPLVRIGGSYRRNLSHRYIDRVNPAAPRVNCPLRGGAPYPVQRGACRAVTGGVGPRLASLSPRPGASP